MGVVDVPADQEEVGEPLGALLPLVAQREGRVVAVVVPEGNCESIGTNVASPRDEHCILDCPEQI